LIFIIYNNVEETMKIRLFLLLIVFPFYTHSSSSKNKNACFVQQNSDILSQQTQQMLDAQELTAQCLAVCLMHPESMDSFLNNPQSFAHFIPKSYRRSLLGVLGDRNKHQLKDWLCMDQLNGYEKGIKLQDVNQLGFKKLYFLIALYEKARVYAPLDIRSNPGLQAIYDNLDQEIKDFIYYYVVTPDYSAVALPTLATAARNSANFLLSPLRILSKEQ